MLNPKLARSDVWASGVQSRCDGVAAGKRDLLGRSQLDLRLKNQVGQYLESTKVNFGQAAAVEPDSGLPARNRPKLSRMTTVPADARQHRRCNAV